MSKRRRLSPYSNSNSELDHPPAHQSDENILVDRVVVHEDENIELVHEAVVVVDEGADIRKSTHRTSWMWTEKLFFCVSSPQKLDGSASGKIANKVLLECMACRAKVKCDVSVS